MEADTSNESYVEEVQRIERPTSGLKVLYATDEEAIEHEKRLDIVDKKGENLVFGDNLQMRKRLFISLYSLLRLKTVQLYDFSRKSIDWHGKYS